MLKTRVLTALVLLPAALALVFLASAPVFAVVISVIAMIGAFEFRALANLGRIAGIGLLVLQAAILFWLAWSWPGWTPDPVPVFQLACLAWAVMFVQVATYRPGRKPDMLFRIRGFLNALGVITLGWIALAWLRAQPEGAWWFLLLLLAVISADVGAYFTGRAVGGRKLAPGISPGKTMAGLFGGLALALVVTPLAAWLIPALEPAPLGMATLGLVTAAASVGGDLFISMHKRVAGLKDTGRIFPGHGGMLDRLDSLLAAAPFFALVKLLLGL